MLTDHLTKNLTVAIQQDDRVFYLLHDRIAQELSCVNTVWVRNPSRRGRRALPFTKGELRNRAVSKG